ncbi:transcriptional regulator, TetR family [Parvibaculum lavamentivorans DS-1]|uniref:Transcriptional regulator, TetR family n=1 Tax=Parvibaculum lavamentivorans (strain DS-1 / DSM 13023 / NCIMB 13966) TaxID=402881 RepID=A7HWI2_PARL1|nr:TetR/AcrR family transcriptional regulator [Parvibaculum lavamentivorans]ABS64265.1 transcriptional regulator, TetR family [Parvibaculum lavamentivorans DS-1]
MKERESTPRGGSRWNRDHWVEFGVRSLARHGPGALTVDRLCERAKLTKGSFYHHFKSVDDFLVAVGERWRRTETDAIARNALAGPGAAESLKKLASLSDSVNHRLEIGVRTLAANNRKVRDLVNKADIAREAIISTLLQRAYDLTEDDAANAARLFHSLHLAALLRAPSDVGGFSSASARFLTAQLRDAAPSRTTRKSMRAR